MRSKDIRQAFLDFFEGKEHKIVPSAPMVVKNDPTLMFTNAGMNQFKDLFLGNSDITDPRVADTQKCLRVSGKHNDLEEVGVDTYHHTMFEMLGNWSFGDYFKEEAIAWAWELLTEVYKINKEDLYVTVFGGDEADGLDRDEEAAKIWAKYIPEDRILDFDRKDNFWEMGDTGPCGPCSEIHVDVRSAEEKAKIPGKDLVNQDHPQVIEIWNLVFMQFNRMASGELKNLPAQHVDTGMGFERLAMVLQGKQSNYDTDVFQPLINKLEEISGKKYVPGTKATEEEEHINIALRVIADHIRAIAFSITDGQLPSNTGAGYVIRRILRRAIRYGFQTLELKEAFMFKLVDVLADQMGHYFPELKNQQELIEKVVKEEESSFFKTLEQGLSRLDSVIEGKKQGESISGDVVFELYDTYGFPADLTRLVVSEKGFSIDEEGFKACLEAQRSRSREATAIEADDWVELMKDDVEEFIGYDQLSTHVYITRYRKVKAKGKELYQLVFNLTPFYAEGGGQVGDTGIIRSDSEGVRIVDTKRENNLIIHFAEKLPENPKARFEATVDHNRRAATQANHSATHLLHEALRDVLGEHVEQKGSLVAPNHLRFDFSHFQKVTDEELEEIERQVNQKIKANMALEESRAIPIEDAKEMGAMALFGEKYGDLVRVIKFGDSIELCGGTHVNATSEIGLFKITSESAVAAGIRRIEAITSDAAMEYYKEQEELMEQIREVLKNPKDPIKAISDLLAQNKELQKKVEQASRAQAGNLKGELLNNVEEMGGVSFIGSKVDLDAKAIKDLAFQLRNEVDNLFMILGSDHGGKPTITLMIADNLVKEKDWNAGQLIRTLAQHIKGGGGGQPFFATAGGKDISGLQDAINAAKEIVKN